MPAGPSNQPKDRGLAYLALDFDGSGANYLWDDVMMQICDERDQCDYACNVYNQSNASIVYGSWLEFLPARALFTTYVHRRRCG